MNRIKYLYLIWLLPLAFLFLSLHQTAVYYGIIDTYKNGTSYTAEVVDFEVKQIATQTSGYIILRFGDEGEKVQQKLSLPVEMASQLTRIRVVPIRYQPGNFQEIVMMPTYETQKNLVWTNIAMAVLGLLIAITIAIIAHRFVKNKIKSDQKEIEFERID